MPTRTEATPERPVRVLFFHIMKSNFSGAQQNIYRLLRRIDRDKIEPVLVGQVECELTRRVRTDGIETVIIPFPPALDLYDRALLKPSVRQAFRVLRALWTYNVALIHEFRAKQPDVVWCDNIRTFFTTYVACRVARTTMIWNIWSEPAGTVAWFLHRVAFFLADRVNLEYVDQGPKIFGRLASGGAYKKKVVPLYTGVSDFERSIGTDIRRELGLTPEDVLLIMASNIVPGKGQVDLLAAMEVLVNEFSHLHLLIAGAPVNSHTESMKYHETVRELAAQDTVAANVHLLGWRSDIRDILEASDVYVSTSYSESFPDAVRDAMSTGKPVVVTDVGGTSDLVRVGKSGYLFQPGDIPSLVGHIRKLVSAPALRMEMGVEGTRIIEKRFSTAAYVSEFENMVLSTLPRGRGRWALRSTSDTTIDSGIT